MASPTNGSGGTQVPPVLPSIPLSAERTTNGDASIGHLVGEATRHVETMLKGQLELAKAELTTEIKKGVKGSVLFLVALTILLFSLFFFFIALAELLTIWLMSWAAYLIVFGIMLAAAGVFALLGYQRVRRIRAPKRTISELRETASTFTKRGHDDTPVLER